MADQRFKVEQGLFVSGANNIFTGDATVGGNTTVEGDLLLVKGNFTVQGTTTYTGTTYYDTDIIPLVDNQRLLGSSSNTFVAYLGNTTITQFVHPSANNKQLGNTTKRWDASVTNLDGSGTLIIGGNVTINSTAFIVDSANLRAAVNAAPISTAAFYVVGNTTVNGSINIVNGGNLVVNGNISANGGVSVNGVIQTTNTTLTAGKTTQVTTRTQVTTTTATTIDQFATSSGKFAKLMISVDNSTSSPSVVHAVEMLLAHDSAGNVIATKYAELYTTKLGTFDASISGSNVVVTFTATTANTYNVTALRQLILD
jgi:hypothetical protein